jgi:pyruvate-formate lyase-activating enzyme
MSQIVTYGTSQTSGGTSNLSYTYPNWTYIPYPYPYYDPPQPTTIVYPTIIYHGCGCQHHHCHNPDHEKLDEILKEIKELKQANKKAVGHRKGHK